MATHRKIARRKSKKRYRILGRCGRKITDNDRKEIRRLKEKKWTNIRIAKKFNVTHQRIQQIISEDCYSFCGQQYKDRFECLCDRCERKFITLSINNSILCPYCSARSPFYLSKNRELYDKLIKLRKKHTLIEIGKKFFPKSKYPVQRTKGFIEYYEKLVRSYKGIINV